MENTKNLTIAVTLSLIILILWQIFYVNPRVEQQRQRDAALQAAQKEKKTTAPSIESTPSTPVLQPRENIIATNIRRVAIENADVKGSINLKGARFDDLSLKHYHTTTAKDAPNVSLLSPDGSNQSYFAEFSWLSNVPGAKLPNKDTLWSSDHEQLTTTQPVTLSWNNRQGQVFYLKISLDEHYMFTVEQWVDNTSAQTLSLSPYGLVRRVYYAPDQTYIILHEGALGVFDELYEENSYEDLKDDGSVSYKQTKGWMGITDKYWLSALIPDKTVRFDGKQSYIPRENGEFYQIDFLGNAIDIAPGSSQKLTHYFFAGAKKVSQLTDYEENLDILMFDHAVDFGYLYYLTKPMFYFLKALDRFLGSFGLAILMLTVILKLALFPLANKSYLSMHKLKLLHPRIMELKEQHKDNKAQFNKEMMDLYKKEGVNPMSGCLPILIQIPIFFALYKVLFVSIEMRHTPFYGWIKDLSAQDPTSLFNLFGLLPYDVPQAMHIGAWPVILGVTMILQQKLNPAPTDPIQAKIMKLLPYFFVVFLATFPAGLVIYWSWSNGLSILQQWYITRNVKRKFG